MITNEIISKVRNNNISKENQTFSEFACKSIEADYKDEKNENPDVRSSFFHDSDKIIHSKAYSRYIDKTQVFSLFENDHVTHRVLHVQFVAKIGRTIGRSLCLNEDLIEAIALGHDLGHSPYGHDGEHILDAICKEHKIGFFRHNAQSVKCLMELEGKGKNRNISLQVLDGILTHNGEMLSPEYHPDYNKSWEQFEFEYDRCFNGKKDFNKIRPMTLEGCVVRISDIIAYIGRDIEDAITLNVIKRDQLPSDIVDVLGNTNKTIINCLVSDLISQSIGKNYLAFSENIYTALIKLKKFNFHNIYKAPIIKTENIKIENMFITLFNKYLDEVEKGDEKSLMNKMFLKKMDSAYLAKTNEKRQIIDFIAGMTDDYLKNQFKEMFFPKNFGYKI